MLNLSHPLTQHIFRASALMDAVMDLSQKLAVSPSADQAESLAQCLRLFDEMRELAHVHFCMHEAFIRTAIDEYEAAIRHLASLGGGGQITEDRRDGEGNCSTCDVPFTKLRPLPLSQCGDRDKPYIEAHSKLASPDGFGTWAI